MTNGTKNKVKFFHEMAMREKKNMYVGQEWENGVVIGYAIWIYPPGQKHTDGKKMATASCLDVLHGR